MRDLDHQRATWQGQLNEQVHDMRIANEGLRRETQSLATALRKPQVRGRWGELHLRRAVELAGLVDRCDFTEQARLDDGARRPDLVVHLVGGRSVVVDAKVPLDAYLDATTSDDDDERAGHLHRHARQLRTHVDLLGGKTYWRSLEETPEFVVLFLPAESFLAAALEADPGLLEHAAARQVVLATPTTLIALLRTVAHGWSHEALADQAREVHRLGRDLYGRLGTMATHFDHVGRSLNAAVGHYNQTVGLPGVPGAGGGAPAQGPLAHRRRRGRRDPRAALGGAARGRAAWFRRRPAVRPYRGGVSEARTLWEEGPEPGHQVVALALALALTVVALEVTIGGEVGRFFDIAFVLVCVTVALLVRPQDFFTVGVLPPLVMLVVFTLVAVARPAALADRGDSLTQTWSAVSRRTPSRSASATACA